jgi:hypothetical protein
MEIKTTEDIMYEYVNEEDHCLTLYDMNQNVQWVRVEDVINWIDKLRKSNDMWRYAVDDCFGMLEDALTSNSANAKTNED